MLLRCDIDPEIGLYDLNQCRLLGAFFQARGYKIGYAINRAGIEQARHFLGEEATLHRMPDDLSAEAERLGHLGRTHKHHICFSFLRKTTSAYLFHVQRLFDFTAVVDRGSPFLLYGNLILDGRVSAPTFPYSCSPEAKLLLGPKFHICDPSPIPIPSQNEPITEILLNIGNQPELLRLVFRALRDLPGQPELHVLTGSSDGAALIQAEAEASNNPHVRPLLPDPGVPFLYHRYALILTQAHDLCLEFAHQGLCFATVAIARDQVQEAYCLEQRGISPSLGWFGSKREDEIRQLIAYLLTHPEARQKYSRVGRQSVDGQALWRLVRFLPPE